MNLRNTRSLISLLNIISLSAFPMSSSDLAGIFFNGYGLTFIAACGLSDSTD